MIAAVREADRAVSSVARSVLLVVPMAVRRAEVVLSWWANIMLAGMKNW